MWHSAPSGGLLVAGALQTMPSYDTAMFWSQLSSIPVIAVFFAKQIGSNYGGFLLLALMVVGMASGGAVWLKRLSRSEEGAP